MLRRGRLVGVLVAALSLLLVPGASALTPDRPTLGHRLVGAALADTGAVLVVEVPDSTLDAASTWLLDVTSGRWSRVGPGPSVSTVSGFLVHLPDREAGYFVGGYPFSVWTFERSGQRWLQPPIPAVHPELLTDVVVDVRRNRILGWSDPDDRMWTYDPATNMWVAVKRTSGWPTTAMPDGSHGYSLLTFDTVLDRAVLSILPIPGRIGQTWLFDPASRTWERRHSAPPAMMFGYGEWGTEAVYDPVHRRTVLFSESTIALYDSEMDRWRVPENDRWPSLGFEPEMLVGDESFTPWPKGMPVGSLARSQHQLVIDGQTGRVLLVGGNARFRKAGATGPWDVRFGPVREVWAYDVGSNTWRLLKGS